MMKSKAFILMDRWASKVSITNTIFRNFMFIDGIVTNIQYLAHKSLTKNINIQDTLNCSFFNASFATCHSITIDNSTFSGYLPYKVSMTTSTVRYLSIDKGVEAFIMRVRSLNGPIVVKHSTFKNLISIKREFLNADKLMSNSFCYNTRADIDISQIPNVENFARYIRRTASLFKQPVTGLNNRNYGLSISSCFDIRYLQKGLTLYQNTFQQIYGTTGPALHLEQFENTLSKSLFDPLVCL